jgi:hypothetical protein
MLLPEFENVIRPKEWYSIELPVDKADGLKGYLKSHRIYFEPSSAGNLIHFECYMNDVELDLVNDYLERTNGYDPKARIE